MKIQYAVPAISALVYRAYSKNSLTPAGIVVAIITAIAHAYHPWNLPFVLLATFFLAGSRVTHVKENVKAKLTMGSKGTAGGEGPRTHVQVLANSLMASILSIMHGYQLRRRAAALADPNVPDPIGTQCFSWGGDVLVLGIIANYAAVAADTFSSELGILSRTTPRLITSPTLRKVPRGTNGGVTIEGLAAGVFGSVIIVTVAIMFLPMCSERTAGLNGGGRPWYMAERRQLMTYLVIWGALGSVLDSFLGAVFQRSVRDVRSGKIVEGEGGHRVIVNPSSGGSKKRAEAKTAVMEGVDKKTAEKVMQGSAVEVEEDPVPADKYSAKDKHRKSSFGDERPSRVVESGWDLLDNNDVNFLMAAIMSVGAMAIGSWIWEIPIENVLTP